MAGPNFLNKMGSTSSAVSGAAFTGSSAFASQLEQVISTAVARASAPLTQLDDEQSTLQGQQSELQTLTNDFTSLQSALQEINTTAQSSGLSAQVDNSNVATASVGSGALAGTYSLDVTSLGSQTNTISLSTLPKVSDPSASSIDTSTSYTLTVGTQTYNLTPSSDTLDALVSAINNSGASVQATIVNVGSSTNPDYQLSVQSQDYGPIGIQLTDSSNKNLLETVGQEGSYVQYQINGEPATPVDSTSRNVTISPGLTATLTGTGTANITVSASTEAVSNALSNFVSAYNQAVSDLQKNRGQNGGALTGQSIVYELQDTLNQIANYASGGTNSVSALADLGVSFDDTSGTLQLDTSTLSSDNPSDVLNFLGSIGSGGFLDAVNNMLNDVTDPTTGLLTEDTKSITTELSQIGTQISSDQTNINNLQTSLTNQMATADATISSLEQQVTEITDLFTTMQENEMAQSGL